MKRFVFLVLWTAAVFSLPGCGEDDQWSQLKSRCLDFCKVFERCVPNQPAEYEGCLSSCNAFDKASTGEEYKDYFLCKEECVENATPQTECTCLLKYEDGGPNC
jgi:hypothetical protein